MASSSDKWYGLAKDTVIGIFVIGGIVVAAGIVAVAAGWKAPASTGYTVRPAGLYYPTEYNSQPIAPPAYDPSPVQYRSFVPG